ncbi:MAG: putative membrane protein [Polaribacter sp.]|jgi:putative membrane protein
MIEEAQQSYQWEQPERQSPVAILLILFQFVTKLIKQFWPFLIIIFFRQGSSSSDSAYFEAFALVLGLGSTLASIISYFKFYFYVKGEELVIEKGIFQKVKLNIPFERIQTISFQQNLIHQFFNVVSLEIDTAGSKGKEFSILALKKEKAEAIRNFLIAQIPVTKDNEGEETDQEVQEAVVEETLLQLSLKDLLKIGVGQNHLRGLGIIVAAIFALAEIVDTGKKGFVRGLFEFFNKGKETLSDTIIWIYLTPTLIVFLLLTSFVMTFLNYYDLRFLKTTKGFKVIAGLLNRKEQSAAMQKIQMIEWTTNPLKKIFEMYDIRLLQASSAALRKKQSFYVPGCYEEQLQSVRQAYMPKEASVEFESHGINRRIINKRVMLIGLLPLIPFSISQFLRTGSISVQLFLWTALVIVTSYIYWKRYRYFVSEEGIRIQKGIFVTKYTLLKYYKIQGAVITQSIFQQRNGYANLKIFTAAGNVRIPYIELEKAQALMDVLLWKVESSKKGWM